MPADGLDRLQPVGRLADHLEVVLGVEDHPEAGAHERLVVGDQHAHGAHATAASSSATSGSRARTKKPPPRRRPLSISPPKTRARSRMPTSPWPAPSPVAGPAAAVGDLQLELALAPAHAHLGGGLRRMLEHVGERLLDDPVGGEVEPGRQRPPLALLVQHHGQPGGTRALEQRVERAQRGLRRQRRLLLVRVQHAEQPPHLGQRLAAGALDLLGRGHRAPGVALQDPPRAAGLHDHDADAVGDDVVHLARDPPALLGGGAQRLALVRLLRAHRLLVQLLGRAASVCARRGPRATR